MNEVIIVGRLRNYKQISGVLSPDGLCNSLGCMQGGERNRRSLSRLENMNKDKIPICLNSRGGETASRVCNRHFVTGCTQ